MSSRELDISSCLTWEEGLPRPQWDLIITLVETHASPEEQADVWVAVGRKWIGALHAALGDNYEVAESDHFLGLAPKGEVGGGPLLWFAERCRTEMSAVLSGVADFSAPGKQVLVALRNPEAYYRYISPFYPEGEHGGSGGIHIREGYPHVALYGKHMWMLENTLAHELTHVCLHHLSLPQWLEEGLAQMFEHNMTGRLLLQVDAEMAARHKKYWGKHGLDDFWRGEGFSRPGKVQELCYQLAEILVRLLIEEECRSRWFGFVKEPQRRLFAFVREANAADCGQSASQQHLGFGIDALAGRFLGPGAWTPSL